MKIALMFLTRSDIHHCDIWKQFLSSHEDKFNVYIHNKEPLTDPFFEKFIIPETCETHWGHISLVKSTLLLLKYALQDENNQRFILLSESTIPVHNFGYIYNRLTFMDCNYFAITNVKRRVGHQWFIINRKFADFCVKNDFTNEYINIKIPDEKYFIDICMRFKFSIRNTMTTYCDWSNFVYNPHGGRSPKTFTEFTNSTLISIRKLNCFFARKIDKDCVFKSIDFLKK